MPAGGLRHRETALAHETDRLTRAQRRHGCQGGELPDRVPDHDVGLDPLGPDRGQDGKARRDERRLLHLGLDECFERGVEAELLEIEPGGLAPDPVDVHRCGHRFGELAAHARFEGTLPRETERDLAHRFLPAGGTARWGVDRLAASAIVVTSSLLIVASLLALRSSAAASVIRRPI